MSITKILGSENATNEEKLEAVAAVVAGAREAYGNSDVAIAAPEVQTAYGVMGFVHLEDDAKVNLLAGEVQRIKAQAIEYVAQNPGTSLNRKVEELLAVNGMFVNISAGTKFEYI